MPRCALGFRWVQFGGLHLDVLIRSNLRLPLPAPSLDRNVGGSPVHGSEDPSPELHAIPMSSRCGMQTLGSWHSIIQKLWRLQSQCLSLRKKTISLSHSAEKFGLNAIQTLCPGHLLMAQGLCTSLKHCREGGVGCSYAWSSPRSNDIS